MRRVIGQASQRVGRLVHRLVQLGLLLMLLAMIGLAALAWRLDQGPLALPWLARQIEQAAGDTAGQRVSIASAALVWEGFSRGVDRPLDIRLTDVTVHDHDGTRLALLPLVDVSLSLRGLVIGRIVPRALVVQGARLLVVRNADGSLAIDLGGAADPAADIGAASVGHPPPPILGWVFAELARPADTDLVPSGTPLSQFRRLQIRDTVVSVIDRSVGVTWQVPQAELDLRRGAQGGLEGNAAIQLMAGGQRLAIAARVRLPATGALSGQTPGGGALAIEAEIPPVVPADFAGIAPAFAPLVAIQAPVALTLTAEIGPDLLPRQALLQARMASGSLRVAAGSILVEDGMAEIRGTMDAVQITLNRLAVTARPGQPATLLTGAATVRRVAGMFAGVTELHLDQVAFADLGTLWPDGVGGPGAKIWITGNITGGTAHDLNLRLELSAAPDLSDGIVTSMTGTVDGRDMTVHWLRPVPPVEGVNAKLHFRSADLIEIDVLSGAQAGMVVSSGSVTLTGLAKPDQFATIVVNLGGPVTDLLAVLNHPRVNLLSRRPLPMRNPAGRVEGTLVVTALPLENDLTMEEVRLSAEGRLIGLRLGGIAAGRDLTDGNLAFQASNDGLKLNGTAALAGIPAQLQVAMDFREGPPTQVIQKVAVSATVEMSQLASFGLDVPELALTGSAALKIDLVGRRSGRSELNLSADLARTGLRADRLNWGKPAGRPAVAELRVLLDGDRLAGVERLRVEGDGVNIQGVLDTAGGAPRRLRLTRAVLGTSTNVQGEVTWPRTPGDAWVVQLSGATLDATGAFGPRGAAATKPEAPQRGPPWKVDARVERLLLGPGRTLNQVAVRVENDGVIMRSARLTGRTAGGGFEFAITPGTGTPGTGAEAARRRVVTGVAQDTGGLLAAFDVLDDMRGGQLTLRGTYDDTRPDHPLSGTMEIAAFSLRNPPAIAKVLQALSGYGAFEALQGPDLNVTQLVAPFRYAGEVLDLTDARAFSASLGMTVKGRIDLGRRLVDVQGTVVPSYFLNSLLGRIPLLGRLLSPEIGGGLFAMSYGMRGPIDDPTVWVNPLSAVTPGFLRGLFGIFEGSAGGGAEMPATPDRPNYAPPSGGQN